MVKMCDKSLVRPLFTIFRNSLNSLNSLEVRSMFLDISKAFHKVWHEGLLYKLKSSGISKNLLNLIKRYLTDRS